MTDFGDPRNTNGETPKPAVPTGPLLSQLAGMAEARQWGEAVARDIELYRQKKLAWTDVDPGCVLHGPPGTGKTTYAKALAATCKLPLVATSFGQWQSVNGGHLGSTIEAMQAAFAQAVANAPCILFIDELDSVPARGGAADNKGYFNAFTNALLKAFDNLADVPGVIVIGACNHPNLLDPALVRSGRMDRMIAIALPTTKQLEGILRFHLTAEDQLHLVGYDADPLPSIALLCAGMSGADVAKLVRGARSHARSKGRTLAAHDFMAVLDPPDARPSPEVRQRIAVHEAGHAVAALRLRVSDDITTSIVTMSSSSGRVSMRSLSQPMTREAMENQIVTQLAGRAAEEVAFGAPSNLSGGDNTNTDLAQATALASAMVSKLGFSYEGGLLWHGTQPHESDLLRSGPLGQEIRIILAVAYARALQLVRSEQALVMAVADALLSRRALSHRELVDIEYAITSPSRTTTRIAPPAEGYAQLGRTNVQPPLLVKPVPPPKRNGTVARNCYEEETDWDPPPPRSRIPLLTRNPFKDKK